MKKFVNGEYRRFGMSNKYALVLVVILVIMNSFSKKEDRVQNILEAVEVITLVAREKPVPDMIGKTIGNNEDPRIEPAPKDPRIEPTPNSGYIYIFQQPDSKILYYFYIYDNKLTRVSTVEEFHMPRGLTSESLTQLYIKTLTKYFGFPPKIEDVPSIRFEVQRKSLTWNNIELYIVHREPDADRDPSLVRRSVRDLWEKEDFMDVFFFYHLE